MRREGEWSRREGKKSDKRDNEGKKTLIVERDGGRHKFSNFMKPKKCK